MYCLDATGVQPLDDTTSDPFLKLRLGSHKINDQEHYVPETVTPEFYRYPACQRGVCLLGLRRVGPRCVGANRKGEVRMLGRRPPLHAGFLSCVQQALGVFLRYASG